MYINPLLCLARATCPGRKCVQGDIVDMLIQLYNAISTTRVKCCVCSWIEHEYINLRIVMGGESTGNAYD